MSYYVRFRIKGRNDFCIISEQLLEKGFQDRIEYFNGGWHDELVPIVEPHLKFENEDDAIAFVLAFGGKVETDKPLL